MSGWQKPVAPPRPWPELAVRDLYVRGEVDVADFEKLIDQVLRGKVPERLCPPGLPFASAAVMEPVYVVGQDEPVDFIPTMFPRPELETLDA